MAQEHWPDSEPLVARLRALEAECIRLSSLAVSSELEEQLKVYESRLNRLESAHSRSWFGEHSNTYFENFEAPPAGQSFDVEWGFIPGFHGPRNAGWRTYARDEVRKFVFDGIGEDVFHAVHDLADRASSGFSISRDQALDVLAALASRFNLPGIDRYRSRIEAELLPYTVADSLNASLNSAPRMTRDSEEIAKGRFVPLHVQYLSALHSVEVIRGRCREVASVLRNVIEALSLYAPPKKTIQTSSRVFIGHGRSEQWRILKDFLQDRLSLSYEEFNRVPVAGINTQERLSEMLDSCSFAFLVMTAEDEHESGSIHARENVIHEAGIFQGRLGWRKAIILLEDGCQEFSNIVGLGQVRFPKESIGSCFEEIRRVLERENVVGRER